jgi:hypothetical protein
VPRFCRKADLGPGKFHQPLGERYLSAVIPQQVAAGRDARLMNAEQISRPGGKRSSTGRNQKQEQAMKLNSTQVTQALSQFDAQVLPESHPAVSELNDLFGEHTFFLDRDGLNVLEPAATPEAEAQTGEIVSLASWSDSTQTSLRPHEPEPTGVVVVLERKH